MTTPSLFDARDVVLGAIADWVGRGRLRSLDGALARFVADVSLDAAPCVLLATALLAHLEGRGHTCLLLDDLLDDHARLFGWDDDGRSALDRTMAELPRTVAAWTAALAACSAVHVDRAGRGYEHGGGTPLVLSGTVLYLRRYWAHERRIAAAVVARSERLDPIAPQTLRPWLDRLFPAPLDDGPDWQKVACAIALQGRLALVTGGPGTGKTFTAARLVALLLATSPDPAGLRIALAAPTGKAAARLRQSIAAAFTTLQPQLGLPPSSSAAIGPARTLHALLGSLPGTRRFRHHAGNPLDVDLVLVDEASMIHVEMMDALLAALPPTARIVLLGDKDQLASVEAGAVLGELCRTADAGLYRPDTVERIAAATGETIPAALRDDGGPALAQRTVMLRRSQRFAGAIGAFAAAVNAGDATTAEALLARGDAAVVRIDAASVVALAVDGYRPYLESLRGSASREDERVRGVLDAFDRFRLLGAVRHGERGVTTLGRAIEAGLAERGLIARDVEWYEGRPVLVTRNDYGVGVFNGDIGIALRIDGQLRVCFADGSTVRSIGVGRLAHVETAFAMTVHKAQGSEFDHAVLVLPDDASPVVTRELVYTAITRARSTFTLATSRADALVDAIGRSTRRSSGLMRFVDAGGTEGTEASRSRERR